MRVFDATTNTWFASLSAAITASHPNDVLQVAGGHYVENFPNITHNLTIDAVGGLASLSTPQPQPANGRAILFVPLDQNVSLTISGLVLSGAINDGDNGAGILFENGNDKLTVNNCWVHGNQDGILVGGADAASRHGMTVTIANSEINQNGVPLGNSQYGLDHNLYVGPVTSLVVTNSYIHGALGGHEIKSRALSSVIANNRIVDGPTAHTSYSIDLPDGGTAVVSGNVIEKGPAASNQHVIHFAGEAGITYPGSALVIEHNTIINDRAHATLLLNQSQDSSGHSIPATITGNTLYNVNIHSLYQDGFGPPPDNASDNTFIYGPAPPLNAAHPFTVVFLPEPPGIMLLPLALLVTALLRHRRNRTARRAAPPRRRAAGQLALAAPPSAHPASA